MRTKTAIYTSALLLGTLAAAVIVVAILSGGGGSAASNPLALATSVPDLFRSDSAVSGDSAKTTSGMLNLPPGEGLPAPAPASDSLQTTTNDATTTAVTDSVTNSVVDRKIERQATLDVTVDDVGTAVTRIEAAATAAGGFISQETITQASTTGNDDQKRQQATVQIRVPADKYTAVMNDLRGLAKDVTNENSQTSEVTGQYSDLQSQLRNLQSTEAQYLTLMGQATTIGDILTVSDRLSSVQGQIEQIQGQLQLIDNLTAMATITISVTLPPLPAVTEPAQEQKSWASEAWTNAWDASQDVMRALGTGAITAGVVFVWVVIPGMVGLGAWRIFGTRRKRGEAPSA